MSTMNLILLCFALLSIVELITSFSLSSSKSIVQTRLQLEMKGKGKRVPIDQRGEFVKRQRILEAQAEMDKRKPTGVPIFKIFVRPVAGGIWLPCGDLAGDQRATSLVNAWLSGFLTDTYRDQLDQGIARSVFNQEDSFVKGITENFKPFKKFTKEELQFGYKVEFPGIVEKFGDLPITPLVKGMEKSWFDKAKDAFGDLFKKEE